MSLKIENYEVMGWEHAIRGMRNPKNSWEKSDTRICHLNNCDGCDYYVKAGSHGFCKQPYIAGPNDMDLMMRLRDAGTDHRKFMRMITVYVDITAPLYWWKEFDTYKVGTVANSCSTMHKIHEKEFTLEDFSCEKLYDPFANMKPGMNEWKGPQLDLSPEHDGHIVYSSLGVLKCAVIPMLNMCREMYNETKEKTYWEQMIQLLPSSYNQRRTIMLNYEVLANMYKSRRHHKLDEWYVLCDWIESLPYSEIIVGGKKDGEEKL